MRILNLFSVESSEIGLSDLARLSGLDKAASRRLLVALASHNYIEQNPATRKYRLGSGFLRLAQIRETTLPIGRVSQEVADWLSVQTGETAHVSVPSGDVLATIAHCAPVRGTVVHIDAGELVPLNATASGIVYLGFVEKSQRDLLLSRPLRSYAADSITDPEIISALSDEAFLNGFAFSANSFENDVCGVAVPFFDCKRQIAGTLGVAMPSARMNPASRENTKNALFEASRRITSALGGLMHENVPQPGPNSEWV